HGPVGIHCYDMDGKKLWSRDLGPFPSTFGSAASPIILGDMVIQNCDATGKSYLIALDKKTGEPVWRVERSDMPKGGWSTPILIDAGERKELILNGEFGVKGYDPKNGKELWFCKSFNGRGTPVPAWAHGLLITVNGKPGDIYAVRPGGKGDVTKTHMAWHSPLGGGRDLSSPIVVGDYAFVVSMPGIATLYEATTGKTVWEERLDRKYAASPLAANGLIYLPSEDGEVVVIKPGKELEIVARNKIGAGGSEIFRASLAPSDGQIFHRSDSVLYCIGSKAAE
ncbi:MAG: PQQ-like beta-propeller repeat protein, partial [Planctomycetales bacterium]